ncbi:sulfur carrier protein ThiS [Clostridium luticellarii]|jgi:sulfur carrier protein|uniref:Bifunctional sulfur carrier protein/thiazole synthase protein n=1 Tax=Clostridium luticellarii TaxID=1691940 RepID=A0A2T0BPM4_9CLOT|nr:sulfur carrier protein ThiS [Clostridium luticellarii]MCI1945778.1 sulfur carrier protein ThiS [Clostridium luticellarii]MCI1967626.1 sulfur carrier protein ThiS [Clostridium luticellarii]MCI1996469.1 sulfur carrier protein ThiS [Clostridium luticellarii]MCI2041154.1 sulfur carrier protein ThiS [Clostridium luticellarii]PRR85782.1 bifunctional sulfur carrier protein/thiazole synthase protein [Clostridium luticellarii]
MKVTINGKIKDIKEGVTVTEILKIEDVEMPDMVSVQLNDEFVDRPNFGSTILKENDKIDFLYFMGGGSSGF